MQTKRLPYTFNRDGYYYFSRRVPNDVVEHYKYPRVVQSLHTKQHSIARTRALMLSAKLDEHWSHMRLAHADLPGKHLLKSKNLSFPPSRTSSQFAESMSLTEAVETYLTLKGASKTKTFHSATHRSCGYLVDACGLKHLHDYNRSDALAFRDSLIARGLAGSSITRVFNEQSISSGGVSILASLLAMLIVFQKVQGVTSVAKKDDWKRMSYAQKLVTAVIRRRFELA